MSAFAIQHRVGKAVRNVVKSPEFFRYLVSSGRQQSQLFGARIYFEYPFHVSQHDIDLSGFQAVQWDSSVLYCHGNLKVGAPSLGSWHLECVYSFPMSCSTMNEMDSKVLFAVLRK